MKVLGIIAEYNPFHNGHLYHLQKSKEITGATHVVCIMGGNFLQRGEPAIVDKWIRTHTAIEAGIDLVIELPVLFNIQSAEYFAKGAIELLNSIGLIDYLSFGSESGDIEKLIELSAILANESSLLKNLIKENLKNGILYPKAIELSLVELLKDHSNLNSLSQLINNPNNILGIEYIKSLMLTNSKIKPVTIKRLGTHYHSKEIKDNIASATAIRNFIYQNKLKSVFNLVPSCSYNYLDKAFKCNNGPVVIDSFTQLLLGIIRRYSISELSEILGVTEGLENRIKKEANFSTSISELISKIKTKRYTQVRLQRTLMNILINITKNDFETLYNVHPQYVRILGFSNKGKEILKKAKSNTNIPIITRFAEYKKLNNTFIDKIMEYEIISTNLYSLGYKNKHAKKGNKDYLEKIIYKPN